MKRQTLRRKQTSVSSARWVAYATAGAASALGCATSADGEIHYSGLINQSFNAPPGSVSTAFFQLDQPGNSIKPFHGRTSATSGGIRGAALFYVYGIVAGSFAGFVANNHAYGSKLSFGQNISARPFFPIAGSLAVGFGYSNSEWLDPGIGFVGFRFDNGSGLQFGWARLNMDGAPGNSFTLVDYAWGDLGDSIAAGQVPEPGSLALLALGGLGLVAWRRQRAKAAKVA